MTQIAGCSQGFAAVTTRGGVITWGTPVIDVRNHATISVELNNIQEPQQELAAVSCRVLSGPGEAALELVPSLSKVESRSEEVIGLRTAAAFAALRRDDVAIAWGENGRVLQRGVRQLVASDEAFCALLHDGSVQIWGNADYGGDSSAVRHELQKVLQITASFAAFAALQENGTVASWGSPQAGGDQGDVVDRLVQVTDIASNSTSFGSRDGISEHMGYSNNHTNIIPYCIVLYFSTIVYCIILHYVILY